ncbi:MAG: hypothetical protein ACOCXQ_03775 [Patescibacteria group bacterium]
MRFTNKTVILVLAGGALLVLLCLNVWPSVLNQSQKNNPQIADESGTSPGQEDGTEEIITTDWPDDFSAQTISVTDTDGNEVFITKVPGQHRHKESADYVTFQIDSNGVITEYQYSTFDLLTSDLQLFRNVQATEDGIMHPSSYEIINYQLVYLPQGALLYRLVPSEKWLRVTETDDGEIQVSSGLSDTEELVIHEPKQDSQKNGTFFENGVRLTYENVSRDGTEALEALIFLPLEEESQLYAEYLIRDVHSVITNPLTELSYITHTEPGIVQIEIHQAYSDFSGPDTNIVIINKDVIGSKPMSVGELMPSLDSDTLSDLEKLGLYQSGDDLYLLLKQPLIFNGYVDDPPENQQPLIIPGDSDA